VHILSPMGGGSARARGRIAWRSFLTATTLAALGVVAPASVSGSFAEFASCEYVEAGPPGPVGNRLEIAAFASQLEMFRKGERIMVRSPGTNCARFAPTVTNVDAIVLRGESIVIDERGGLFAPGASRGKGTIEISVYGSRVALEGTPGRDGIAAATLADGHIAIDVNRGNGSVPDYDLDLRQGIPKVLMLKGVEGPDRLDATKLTGMGDAGLKHVLRLFGDDGDDTILGGDGAEFRVSDGRGDDLVRTGAGDDSITLGRGHDTVYGGSGDDDISYDVFERFTGTPPDPSDRLFGGAGDDYLSDVNRHSDLLRCGPGHDRAEPEPHDRPAADCER
jgi:hypothetical protein